MNKETIIRLIKNQPVKQDEINQFIFDYIEYKKKPTPTPEQFNKILQLLGMGVFSLKDAIQDGIKMYNLQVQTIIKDNTIIKIDVYE